MDSLTRGVVAIATIIVGASLLALLVSKQSQTPQVISAASNGFANMLKIALSPVVSNGISQPITTY
jgi:hypothetical protein